jgi:glycosyltransferase involved in cell wall biosynthesis
MKHQFSRKIPAMFCSTIIPTVNRPTLSRAVRSVLNQDFHAGDFEVIVVNDSGRPLPDMEWQRSSRVRMISTHQRERSVARNTGAGVATGRYLHFLDDDDVLLPGALRTFWHATDSSNAPWLYGYWRTVDAMGTLIDEFRPELEGNIFALLVAGEGLPLQASLVRTEHFFESGAFDCRMALTGTEDRDLGRRMALRGEIFCVRALAAQVRVGQDGSTTNWYPLSEGDRLGREKVLNAQHAVSRLRASITSGYWRGRTCRALLGSMVWNLKHTQLLTATRRAASSLLFCGGSTLSSDFWCGLRKGVR